MVRVHGTGSKAVNGPEDPFVLTRQQLWQALERKARHPSEFVPILSQCKVLGDKDGVVERSCIVDLGKWGKRPMHEKITTHGDLWIRFAQSEGSISNNIVSFLPNISDTNLMLTYTFEWEFPGVQAGTPDHEELKAFMSQMAIGAVNGSITRAREMVTEGMIN